MQRVARRIPSQPAKKIILRDLEKVRALERIGITTLEKLIESMPTLRPDQRSLGAWLFGRLKTPSAVPVLLKLLQDKRVRWQAAASLGLIGGKRTVKALVAQLRVTTEDDFRQALINALSFSGSELAALPLLEILQDRHEAPRSRALAADGLGSLLCESDRRTRLFRRAVAGLREALRDASPEVRGDAAFALKKLTKEK